MPDWGELFADPVLQGRPPNPEFLSLLAALKTASGTRALDAGCGVGRQLLPLVAAGFTVWGVDREARVLELLRARLQAGAVPPALVLTAQADLESLPFAVGSFDLVVSINVINHGYAQTFRNYCRELDRVLKVGGNLHHVSPLEFGRRMLLPQTRKLEAGTLVDIATPDGNLVHHFPTPQELWAQVPRYRIRRSETILTPIPFMGNVDLPQLVYWGEKTE